MLLGVARISYSDAKLGLDETQDGRGRDADHRRRGGGRLGARRAGRLHGRLPVESRRRPARRSPTCRRPPPSRRTTPTWEKDFAQWVGAVAIDRAFQERARETVVAPDESERDFRIRLQGEAREARDAARRQGAGQVRVEDDARIQDRIRRAEQAVQVQSEQASGAKMGAAFSVGATIFGALLGRKAVSASTLGRATTAARGMSRVGKEAQDVTRATENVTALKAQLAELEGGNAGRHRSGDRRLGPGERAVRTRPGQAETRRRVGATGRARLGPGVNTCKQLLPLTIYKRRFMLL